MQVINRYMLVDFLVMFVMTLLVVTFVMCVGTLIRAIDLLARGVSGLFIFKVFFYNIPFLLTFTIPISVLTTVLLQFGRMSFDGEVTTMKAGGMSIWQIIAPIIMLAVFFSVVCIYINNWLAPRSSYAVRKVLASVGAEDPMTLLEEGRFVRDFPNLMVYIGKKDKGRVYDVVVYMTEDGKVVRSVRAKSGMMKMDRPNNRLLIDLYDVRIEQPEEKDPTRSRYVSAQYYPVVLDLSELLRQGGVRKKVVDMSFGELMEAIRDVQSAFPNIEPEDLLRQRMKLMVEGNKRLALAFACFAFAVLGIPLGVQSRRKESSVGIGISLMVVFFFYFFMVLAESLVGRPNLRPDLIMWFPVLFCEVAGLFLLPRVN